MRSDFFGQVSIAIVRGYAQGTTSAFVGPVMTAFRIARMEALCGLCARHNQCIAHSPHSSSQSMYKKRRSLTRVTRSIYYVLYFNNEILKDVDRKSRASERF